MDLAMKANIDYFAPRAEKPTSSIATKMYDPSIDRS